MSAIAERSAVRTRPRWTRAAGLALVPLAAVLAVAALGVATVRNDSMSPTLQGGDMLVYDRWSSPAHGDIVLVADSEGWTGTDGAVLVKRVIGLPGDVVVCCEVASGRLLRNGEPLDEPYATGAGGGIPFHVTVPDDSAWVIGDNRDASIDSRAEGGTSRGAIALSDVRGVVRLSW